MHHMTAVQQIPEEAGRWESRETTPICKKILQICPGYFQKDIGTAPVFGILIPKFIAENALG